MNSSKGYDFEGVWFETYLEVRRLNKNLQDAGLDESQLREITTSIFIAKTQRGVVRPHHLNAFQDSVLTLLEPVQSREQQAVIYRALRALVDEQKTLTSENGSKK